MALQGKGRIAVRTDGKCFLYLPKSVVDDSAFPFDPHSSVDVNVLIDPDAGRILILPLNKAQRPRKKAGTARSR